MPSTTIQYFAYDHLPPKLQVVSKPVGDLAAKLESLLPDGPEKSAGMRKLLEAKDCFVRCALDLPPAAVLRHQQRVLDEHGELRERLAKLDGFILDNPVFLTLPDTEQGRLKDQSRVMALNADILAARIANF